MSAIAEKLAAPAALATGPATARLEQIAAMYGSPANLDVRKPPEILLVDVMGQKHFWTRIGPLDNGKTLYARRAGP